MLKFNEGGSDDQEKDRKKEPMLEEHTPEPEITPAKKKAEVVPVDLNRLIDDVWRRIDKRGQDNGQQNLPN